MKLSLVKYGLAGALLGVRFQGTDILLSSNTLLTLVLEHVA